MQLQAVNDEKYTAAGLRETVLAAEKSKEPIKLLLKRGDDFVTVSLDYHGGMRYAHLEKVEAIARSAGHDPCTSKVVFGGSADG